MNPQGLGISSYYSKFDKIVYLLQSSGNSDSNAETQSPRKWLVYLIVHGIVQWQMPNILIDEKMLPIINAETEKCHNVWVP